MKPTEIVKGDLRYADLVYRHGLKRFFILHEHLTDEWWMVCPRCKKKTQTPGHGKTRQCKNCGVEMEVWGNLLAMEVWE